MLLRRHILGFALAAPTAAVAFFVIYDWLIPPVTVTSQTIATPLVRAGSDLLISFKVMRSRSCPAVVNQWVFDGQGIQYEVAPITMPPRRVGPDTVAMRVPIPSGAAPGPARYQMTYTHTCDVLDGWYRGVHPVTLPYLSFVIDPAEQAPQPEPQQTK